MSVIWTCLFKFNFWKNHPRHSLGKLVEEHGYWYEWHAGQPSCLIKHGGTMESKTDSHIPLVVPDMQATDHQTRALGDRKQTRAVGARAQQVETEMQKWLPPFTEGLTGEIVKFDRRSPHLDVEIPPPALPLSAHRPVNPTSNRAGRKHNLFNDFAKDQNCEVCRRTRVTRAPC